jgi:hypothetical protein
LNVHGSAGDTPPSTLQYHNWRREFVGRDTSVCATMTEPSSRKRTSSSPGDDSTSKRSRESNVDDKENVRHGETRSIVEAPVSSGEQEEPAVEGITDNSDEDQTKGDGRISRRAASAAESIHDEGEDDDEGDDDDEDTSISAARGRKLPSVNPSKAAEAGIIKTIYCENFMCHRKLRVDLNRNVNFIYGQNGSGECTKRNESRGEC